MNTTHTQTVRGSEIRVGDMMTVLGQARRVVELEPYTNDFARSVFGPTGTHIAQYDDNTAMTIDPRGRYDIIR